MTPLSSAASATTPGTTPVSTARSSTWSTPLATTICCPPCLQRRGRCYRASGAEFLEAEPGQQDATDVEQAFEGAAVGGCFAEGHGVGGAADGLLAVEGAGAIVSDGGGEVAALARGAGEDEEACHTASMRRPAGQVKETIDFLYKRTGACSGWGRVCALRSRQRTQLVGASGPRTNAPASANLPPWLWPAATCERWRRLRHCQRDGAKPLARERSRRRQDALATASAKLVARALAAEPGADCAPANTLSPRRPRPMARLPPATRSARGRRVNPPGQVCCAGTHGRCST